MNFLDPDEYEEAGERLFDLAMGNALALGAVGGAGLGIVFGFSIGGVGGALAGLIVGAGIGAVCGAIIVSVASGLVSAAPQCLLYVAVGLILFAIIALWGVGA